MRLSFVVLVCALLVFPLMIFSQAVPKTLPAKRASGPIKIDGKIKEAAWKDASAALGFTEFRPTPFRVEDPDTRTEVYMLYSDEGIYLAGYCYERTRDSISYELNGRDGFGNNDYIGFVFDTYYDKINGFEYLVTPMGEQMDAKMSPNPGGNSEDFSWNAVWKSAAAIHNDGWTFEVFIPFSAIRFSKKNVQDWGFNITRRRQKTGQQFTWNPIDVNISGFLTQEGVWTGLENIQPPLRLQFSPYFSTYINHYPYKQQELNNWTSSVNGGMDVKYGISQAFTLDVTLIPDFGQVESDRRVLNLTPFEVKYTENRPFFTEGTELFNKGNLFYPRRIGIDPVRLHSTRQYATQTEEVIEDPQESKLINAIKLSGRTKNGLGIGVLNAITNSRYAVLRDTISEQQREVLTDPLTNYNIVVLNQSLKNNSSISLVNSNVLRNGPDYDANVTAALFDFNDKKNMWNLGGKAVTSNLLGYLPNGKTLTGFSYNAYFGKISGRLNFRINQELTNSKFNSNDFGYFTNNNFFNHNLLVGYRWTKPTTWYNNIYLNFNATHSYRFKPLTYQHLNISVNANGQLKNLWQIGGVLGYEPEPNNFYEPRVPGRVFRGWSNWYFSARAQTNSAKNYYVNLQVFYVTRSLFNSKRYDFSLGQNFRFSSKLSLGHRISLEPQTDNVGFAAFSGDEIIFGRRNVSTVENSLNLKYSFRPRMVFTTRLRHYWSEVKYQQYFTLLQNGGLEENTTFNGNPNQNYNTFTVDAVYTWEFAPGSFLNLVWKNNATSFNRVINDGYFKNFDNTIASPANNNLSLKVIYFLDFLTIKSWKKKL